MISDRKSRPRAGGAGASRWGRLLHLLQLPPKKPVRNADKPSVDETGFCWVGENTRIPYRIMRSPRRKRTMSLSLESSAGASGTIIRVAAPVRASRQIIEAFIQNRANWIKHRLDATPMVTSAAPPFGDGMVISYLGHKCLLRVTQQDQAAPACRLAPRRFMVNIGGENLAAETLWQEVRMEIMLWLKKRAKVKLQRRLDLWATLLAVRYQRLVISNPGQRWGSCNVQNVIRLNWRLIMAPLPLIDYVVAHELCHVVHKNHGAGFWRLLATVMPDYQARRAQLRQFEHGLVL